MKNTDLTVGKPFKVLLVYILPLFGSAVFQQLYTLADTIIAGKFAGETALTAERLDKPWYSSTISGPLRAARPRPDPP